MHDITHEDLSILYEDNHILVVLKPQNIAVCPDSSGDISLYDLIKEYLIKTYNKQGDAYLGLVHRLDRPTGGVMIFAKTSKAAARLAECLKDGSFEKKYLAVTIGIPKEKRGQLKNALYKNEDKNEVYCVPIATEGAKMALLDYKILQVVNNYALVEIKLITGRSHQARVQFAHIGTPLFGDQKYGANKTPVGFNLALWAVELRIPHPISKEIMVFRVQPPDDIAPWRGFVIPEIL